MLKARCVICDGQMEMTGRRPRHRETGQPRAGRLVGRIHAAAMTASPG